MSRNLNLDTLASFTHKATDAAIVAVTAFAIVWAFLVWAANPASAQDVDGPSVGLPTFDASQFGKSDKKKVAKKVVKKETKKGLKAESTAKQIRAHWSLLEKHVSAGRPLLAKKELTNVENLCNARIVDCYSLLGFYDKSLTGQKQLDDAIAKFEKATGNLLTVAQHNKDKNQKVVGHYQMPSIDYKGEVETD